MTCDIPPLPATSPDVNAPFSTGVTLRDDSFQFQN